MTNQQPNTPELHRSTIPTELLSRLQRVIESPELYEEIASGYSEHGDAFLAYVFGVDRHRYAARDITKAFTESYVISTDTKAYAFEWLIRSQRAETEELNRTRDWVKHGSVKEFLDWYVDGFREQVENSFHFVKAGDKWHVFRIPNHDDSCIC